MDELKPHCREALKEVERLIDGELALSVRIRIESHLAECPPCLQRVEFRRHLKVMVSSKCGGDVVPAELHRRIEGLIRDLDIPTP
jgi:mycothiol system anti-sigma-R factor